MIRIESIDTITKKAISPKIPRENFTINIIILPKNIKIYCFNTVSITKNILTFQN